MSLLPDYPPSVFDHEGTASWPVSLTPRVAPVNPTGLHPETQIVLIDPAVRQFGRPGVRVDDRDIPTIRFTVEGPEGPDGKFLQAAMVMTLPAAEAAQNLPLAIGYELAKFVRQIVEAYQTATEA